jgi:hypothetical protein
LTLQWILVNNLAVGSGVVSVESLEKSHLRYEEEGCLLQVEIEIGVLWIDCCSIVRRVIVRPLYDNRTRRRRSNNNTATPLDRSSLLLQDRYCQRQYRAVI